MPLASGTTLLDGRYTIERAFEAAKGFARTYRGSDAEGENVVITEFFPSHLVERTGEGRVEPLAGHAEDFRQGLKQFRREAKVLREIDHSNLAREIEDFEERGTAYRVSTHREGASLAEALEKNDGSISERAALTVMKPILEALHALHCEGLLHGGLSPEAIYLTQGRKVLLRGFCGAQVELARKTGVLDQVTISGLSPAEQYDADGRQGPWTDVYAAAAIFYRVVSGQSLPEAREALPEETISEHLDRAGDVISEGRRRVLERALAPRPQGRVQSAQHLREALEDPTKLLGDDEVEAAASETASEKAATPDEAASEKETPEKETPEKSGANPFASSSDSPSAEVWGPASMAAAAAEAAKKDKEEVRARKAQTPEGETRDRPPEPGRADNENAEDEGEGLATRRTVLFSAGGVMLLVLLGAGLTYAGVLDGSAGGSEGGETRYEALRAEGDSLLENANYQAARQRYRRAQQARPSGETGGYVNERLREIERMQAKTQEQSYKRAIRRGDSLKARAGAQASGGDEADQLYTKATEAYLTALQHRPGDSLALARAREVSAQSSGAAPSGQKAAPPEEEEYSTCAVCGRRHEPGLHERVASMYRSQAEQAFQDEDYAEARRRYRSLLDHRPDDEEATKKIEEINALISEADQKKQFRQYRRQGDAFFEKGNLTEAQREYELALDVQPGDSTVSKRLQTIEERLAQQQERQKQYQRHRSEGDVFFENGEMKKAAESYSQALEHRPGDDYVKGRLEKARQQVAATEEKAREREERLKANQTEDGIYKVTDEPPKIVGGLKAFTKKISYPQRAQENGIEGRVYVRVTVAADGSVEDVKVTKGIGYGADAEATRAALNTKFSPGKVDGEPVRAYKTLMAPFRLQ